MSRVYVCKSVAEAYQKRCEFGNSIYLANGTNKKKIGSTYSCDKDIIDLTNLSCFCKDAFCALQTFSKAEEIAEGALKTALNSLASVALRNASTLGGDIALRSADSYLIPVLLAYKAILTVYDENGQHEISLFEYLKKDDDKTIILKVSFDRDRKVAFKRLAQTSSMRAVLVAAINDSGEYFASIEGEGIFTSLQDIESAEFKDSMYGSAEYKKYIAKEVYNLLKEEVNA